MIRPMVPGGLDRVAAIWLEGNLSAHPYIPASDWRENLSIVREQLPQAQVLVWEDSGLVNGFAGVHNGFVAGIFVAPDNGSEALEPPFCAAARNSFPVSLSPSARKTKKPAAFTGAWGLPRPGGSPPSTPATRSG